MADFEFRVAGLAELERKLTALGTRGARNAARRALRQGANVILQATRQATPVRSGNLRRALYTHDRGVMGDSVMFSVDLRSSGFYGRFLEFGTSKMAARPFMRPAAENQAQVAVRVIAESLGVQIEIEAAKA